MKTQSVIALLDPAGTAAIHALRSGLSVEEGIDAPTWPHITISVYDDHPDLPGLVAWTGEVAARHPAFAVRYIGTGLFLSNCLAAFPIASSRLQALYHDHHRAYNEYCKPYSTLESDRWFPHTGLLYAGREAALANIAQVAARFEPFDTCAVALAVSAFDGTGYETLAEFAL